MYNIYITYLYIHTCIPLVVFSIWYHFLTQSTSTSTSHSGPCHTSDPTNSRVGGTKSGHNEVFNDMGVAFTWLLSPGYFDGFVCNLYLQRCVHWFFGEKTPVQFAVWLNWCCLDEVVDTADTLQLHLVSWFANCSSIWLCLSYLRRYKFRKLVLKVWTLERIF